MKILVTGGAGFIGSHIVDAYIEAGHDVLIVDNLSSGNKKNVNPAAKFVELDIKSPYLDQIFYDYEPSIVNHHAAQISVESSTNDPANDADINIIGTLELLQLCVKYNVNQFIFSSSCGVYGDPEAFPTSEAATPRPLSPYAISKLTVENYLRYYYSQTTNLNYTIFRYANIYGPRQTDELEAGVVSKFINLLKAGKIPIIYKFLDTPDGMYRDYCYVKDVAKANLMVLNEVDAINRTFNVGTGIQTTTGRLYRTILEQCRKYGVAVDKKFDNPMESTPRTGEIKKSCLDTEFIESFIGWGQETTFDKGINETVDYFLESQYSLF